MLSLGEHRVRHVNADDPAVGTDFLLDQWEVEARATGDLDHAVPRSKPERLYGPAAVGALGAEHAELRGDVVVRGSLAVRLDQVLSPTVALAHGVLLDRIPEAVCVFSATNASLRTRPARS